MVASGQSPLRKVQKLLEVLWGGTLFSVAVVIPCVAYGIAGLMG